MQALLQNRGFRNLWISQVILALGDACMRMGLLEVFKFCGLNQEVEIAKMFFALTLPGLLFGPFAVAHVDKWPRRNLMVFCDAVRALLLAAMVAWLWQALGAEGRPQHLRWAYVIIFLVGVIVTFYLPARYALLPNLVDPDRLIPANTLLATGLAIGSVGGMPLGAYVAVKLGPLWAVSANAVAYLVSIELLRRIRVETHATARNRRIDPEGAPEQLKEGLVYLWRHPTVMPLVLVAGAFAFLAGILVVTVVGYAEKTLALGTLGLGWLGGAAGVGAGLGVVLLGRGKDWTRSIWLPPVQLILGGVLLGLLSTVREVWLAVPLLVALGGIGATAMIPIDARLQEQVEDHWRGAVFAARGMLTSATMIVAFWLKFGTNILRITPPPTILMWLGIGALIGAGLTLVAMRAKRG